MASSSDTPREPARPENAADGSVEPRRPDETGTETASGVSPQPADEIEDAQVVSDTPARDNDPAEAVPDSDIARQETEAGMPPEDDARESSETANTEGADAERAEDEAAAQERAATEAALMATAGAGVAAGAAAAAGRDGDSTDETRGAPPAAPPPPEKRRGGFLPLVLGGIIAAGLGAGALWYLDREGILRLSGAGIEALEAGLADQDARIDDLSGRTDALAEGMEGLSSDLGAQAERIAAVEAEADAAAPAEAVDALGGRVDGLEGSLGRIDAQLEALQALPIASDPEAMGILESYRTEVAGLRSEVAAVLERSDALIAAAEAEAERADAAEAQLDGIAAEAEAAERRGRARSALRLVETAFANGGPFAAALEDIGAAGIEVPQVLASLADEGVPTHAALQDAYPDGARAALEIALRDVQDRPLAERMTAFLRLQFGMRSLTAREGDDADAVLSRAEAALGEADLDGALAELDALPEAVRAPLAGWIATARTRRAAEAGLAELSAEVESL